MGARRSNTLAPRASMDALSSLVRAFGLNAPRRSVGLVALPRVRRARDAAPLISPYDPLEQNILLRLEPPSAEHLFGTDAFGRDVLSRLIWGARISLVVGSFAILAAMLIGTIIGIVSGYVGGRSTADHAGDWTCCCRSRR